MSLVFADNAKGFTRVAVVVSKKVDKTAVRRNRIRRRIYEVVRRNFDNIPLGRDYVFVVYSSDTASMPYMELEKMIGNLVAQAKVCYNMHRMI